PLDEWDVEQQGTVTVKKVEGDEAHRHVLLLPKRDLCGFAAQALLQFRERQRLFALPAQDFAIEDEFARQGQGGRNKLREFADLIQSPRKDSDAITTSVNLCSNAVVFFFHQKLSLSVVE